MVVKGKKKGNQKMKDCGEIFIKGASCYCELYTPEHGIDNSEKPHSWDCGGFHFEDLGFNTIQDALDKVMDTLCYERTGNWTAWVGDGEIGRFEATTLVDENGNEATKEEVEMWRRYEKRLWLCTVSVRLGVRTVRDLTREEVKDLGFKLVG